MTEADMTNSFDLIDRQDWNWERYEVDRIFKVDKGSSIVASVGDDIIGLIIAINYGRLAFLVFVIVRNSWQGKGIGRSMIEAVLEDLDESGVRQIEIHANPEAVDLYHKFDFQRVENITYYNRDWRGCSTRDILIDPGPGRELKWLCDSDMPAIAELHEKLTDFRMDDCLSAFRRDPPDLSVGLFDDGELSAVLLARIGPSIIDLGSLLMLKPDMSDGRMLLQVMMSELPSGKRLDIIAPSSNALSRAILHSEGFSDRYSIVRMSRSKAVLTPFPPGVIATAMFEIQ